MLSLQVSRHILEQHLVELRHALDLDEALAVHIEVVPQFAEVQVHVVSQVLALETLLLGQDFLGNGSSALFVHPVLRELRLVDTAAVAVATAIERALKLVLALSLQIEAASAVAAAMGVVRAFLGLRLEHEGVTIEDEPVHELIVTGRQVADVDLLFGHLIISLAAAGNTEQHVGLVAHL